MHPDRQLRTIAARYQLAKGKLTVPRDLFADPAVARARATANEIADYLRRHGAFEPHRLGLDDMEYTTMPKLMEKLGARWGNATEVEKPRSGL